MSILLAILGISALVIIHEAGHYFAARAFGMRVLKFSIGFGPTIAKWQPKDSPTVFQIGLIPFMAYVQFAGATPGEETDPNDPELYNNKSALARVITTFGGPFANYLAASIMVFALAMTGYHDENPPLEPMIVENVMDGSPAQKAGIRSGDIIRAANGKPIKTVLDLIAVTDKRADMATEYLVERNGKQLAPFTIVPKNEQGHGKAGIVAKPRIEPMAVDRALGYSVTYPFELTVSSLQGFAHMIKERTTQGLVGPVGMVKIVAKNSDSPAHTMNILILISVSLGFFNLLPLPGLDGGKLAFLGYEVITRKRVNERIENMVHAVGIVLLLCVIALVTLRDIPG